MPTVAISTLRIVELRKVGGSYEETLTEYEWNTRSHSGPQGAMALHLKVKSSRHEMPGSDDVVEHALSATWQPFDLSGDWRDVWMGTGEAERTFENFSRTVGKMGPVRLTIGKHSFVGLMTDFKPDYIEPGYYRWAFTFSPHKNESIGPFRLRAAQLYQKPIPTWLEDAKNQRDTLLDSAAAVQDLPITDDVIADVTAGLGEIVDAVDRIEGMVDNGFVDNAQRTLLAMATTFRRVRLAGVSVAAQLKGRRADLSIAYDDAINELKFTYWAAQSTFDSWVMSGLARDAELDMRSRAATRPRAIYRPKAGEPLERIALRFLGSAEAWRDIYAANHLDSLVLTGTEELIIPEKGA